MANLDKLNRFPNQDIQNRPDECCGETWADIIGNVYNQPMAPDYAYACALRLANSQPTTAGSDPYSGGLGGVVYGAMPTEDEPTDVTINSELFAANIANYPAQDRYLALNFTLQGIKSLYSYQDIVNTINGGTPVQIGVDWYANFNTPNQDGTLPAPVGTHSEHCIAAYEVTPLGLRIKPWLGSNYGDGGYAYMSEDTFNLVFRDAATPIITSRWSSLVKILLTRWYLYADIMPQLNGQNPFA